MIRKPAAATGEPLLVPPLLRGPQRFQRFVRLRLLDELYDLNKKYIAIAAPTFLSMLEASDKKPDDPDEIEGSGRPLSVPVMDGLQLSTMRETVGTLCSMIEAGALGRGGSSAPRILR